MAARDQAHLGSAGDATGPLWQLGASKTPLRHPSGSQRLQFFHKGALHGHIRHIVFGSARADPSSQFLEPILDKIWLPWALRSVAFFRRNWVQVLLAYRAATLVEFGRHWCWLTLAGTGVRCGRDSSPTNHSTFAYRSLAGLVEAGFGSFAGHLTVYKSV